MDPEGSWAQISRLSVPGNTSGGKDSPHSPNQPAQVAFLDTRTTHWHVLRRSPFDLARFIDSGRCHIHQCSDRGNFWIGSFRERKG